jgi:hypothetical protein
MFIVMILLSIVAAIYAGRGVLRAVQTVLHDRRKPKSATTPASTQ